MTQNLIHGQINRTPEEHNKYIWTICLGFIAVIATLSLMFVLVMNNSGLQACEFGTLAHESHKHSEYATKGHRHVFPADVRNTPPPRPRPADIAVNALHCRIHESLGEDCNHAPDESAAPEESSADALHCRSHDKVGEQCDHAPDESR